MLIELHIISSMAILPELHYGMLMESHTLMELLYVTSAELHIAKLESCNITLEELH